jgi:hypothetical protein
VGDLMLTEKGRNFRVILLRVQHQELIIIQNFGKLPWNALGNLLQLVGGEVLFLDNKITGKPKGTQHHKVLSTANDICVL